MKAKERVEKAEAEAARKRQTLIDEVSREEQELEMISRLAQESVVDVSGPDLAARPVGSEDDANSSESESGSSSVGFAETVVPRAPPAPKLQIPKEEAVGDEDCEVLSWQIVKRPRRS